MDNSLLIFGNEKQNYTSDIFYIENWSLWLDISIMVKTLWTILGKRGAY